jgi:branched-subunit amino acid ABC-type transport system permease component
MPRPGSTAPPEAGVHTYLTAVLLSLGAGALYVSLASGLLLTYRSSGVVNFSYGAIAMYGAYMYQQMRANGKWMVPPLPNPLVLVTLVGRIFGAHWKMPSWPTFIDTGGAHGAPVGMVIAIVTTGLLGLVIYVGVFRPMREAPPLAKVVASIGIMLTLQAIVVLRYGTTPLSVPESIPTTPVHLLGVQIPEDRLILAGMGLFLAVVLAGVFRLTRFGWATEASASSEKGAILTGLSPNRMAAINWTLGATLAATVGILVAPVTALSPNNFSLFILPALAALLLAGMRSFLLCAVASFVVAGLQGVATPLVRSFHWLPSTGLSDGLPLLLILIAMTVRGRSLPTRHDLASDRLPLAPEPRWPKPVLVGLPAVGLAMALFLPYTYRTATVSSAIGVVLALSLVMLTGLIGQISLMQMAVAGVSAVLVVKFGNSFGIPFPFSAILAVLAAGIAGLVAALPALRIRGTHLAIVTLAAALAFDSMVLSSPTFINQAQVPPTPSLFGVRFGITTPFLGHHQTLNPLFAVMVLLVTCLAVYVFINLRTSPSGRSFLAVRSNERAAAAAGVSVRGMKLAAFALSGVIAGVAGVLMVYQFQNVSEPTFAVFTSLTAIAVGYLGGITRLSGAVVTGLIASGGLFTVFFDQVVHMPQYYLLITGFGLVGAAKQHPDGIAGTDFTALKAMVGRLRVRITGVATRAA